MREATSAKRSVGIRDQDREFLAHNLHREGRKLCDLRRIFVGPLLERTYKNPSAYYALVRSFSVAERFAERKRSVISDLKSDLSVDKS